MICAAARPPTRGPCVFQCIAGREETALHRTGHLVGCAVRVGILAVDGVAGPVAEGILYRAEGIRV